MEKASGEVVESPSLDVFRKGLDKHLAGDVLGIVHPAFVQGVGLVPCSPTFMTWAGNLVCSN